VEAEEVEPAGEAGAEGSSGAIREQDAGLLGPVERDVVEGDFAENAVEGGEGGLDQLSARGRGAEEFAGAIGDLFGAANPDFSQTFDPK
jgi:hypothetical protein